MEAEILESLNFEIGNPTAITFLKYELCTTEMWISIFPEMKLIWLIGYGYCSRRFLSVASTNEKVRGSAVLLLNYIKNFIVLFCKFIYFLLSDTKFEDWVPELLPCWAKFVGL